MRTDLTQSTLGAVMDVVRAHAAGLAFPFDSWTEDQLYHARILAFSAQGQTVGYCGLAEDAVFFFHVLPAWRRHAPELFERVVREYGVHNAFVLTQDAQMNAVVAEWEIEKRKIGCFFVESGGEPDAPLPAGALFRVAAMGDLPRIVAISGDFFAEESGGFATIEERIEAGTLFVLEKGDDLYGCGVVEAGRVCTGAMSIGMFVNPAFRRMGAAKAILCRLRQYARQNGKQPVAGCWYYNTLSRKSLEASGMAVVSVGYEAKLLGKEELPLRTGNPPGELVEG